jgi:hypothetical protein
MSTFLTYVGATRKSLDDELQTSYSVAMVMSNDDLLMEILLRLHAKPLLKCKSVSKRWCSLIASPVFGLHWRRKSNPGLLILSNISYFTFISAEDDWEPVRVSHWTYERERVPRVFPADGLNLTLLQSCNGLLLVEKYFSYYIYNPITNQFKQITLPETWPIAFLQQFNRAQYRLMLAFNPSKSPHYKLVALIYDKLSKSNFFHIYSSENNTWIKSREVRGDVRFGFGGYWDDAIIWYEISSSSFFIFDIFQDHFEQIPPPQYERDVGTKILDHYFGDCQGHLNIVVNSKDHSKLYVYNFQRQNSKWSLKGCINFKTLAKHYICCAPNLSNFIFNRYRCKVLSFVRRVPEEDSYLVLYNNGFVMSYNFKNETLRKLYNANWEINTSMFVFQYDESLLFNHLLM